MTPLISVAAVLWGLMGLMLVVQWMPSIRQVSLGLAVFIFFLLLITAPALVLNDIIIGFLDMCLPEGWNTSNQ